VKSYYSDGLGYLKELRVVKMKLTTCEDPLLLALENCSPILHVKM
jgi:hypothetical protein